MKLRGRTTVILAILVGLAGCGQRESPPLPSLAPSQPSPSAAARVAGPPSTAEPKRVIGPAVAGIFYPRHEKDLTTTVDKLLAEAKDQKIERLRGLVCPHAGYPFSGKTAAIGFKQAAGRGFRTVIILGPSHYALFEGAALPAADAMETPLGLVRLSSKVAELAKKNPSP